MSKIPYVLADAVYYAATTPDDGTLYDTLVKMFNTLDHVGVKVYREDETVKLPTYSKQGDEGYTGELMIVHRAIDAPFIPVIEYNVGDRVAQILVRHRECIIWDEVESIEELGETERGAGGFGSTGK